MTRNTVQRKNKPIKYIFVVGGVMSGIGKGVTASSVAMLLKARGCSVTALKIDPYINVDAGTMNPTEHGECFVLESGLETDQDMGNYERFLGVDLPPENYMTTGSVYQSVIAKERALKYGGRNVEVVPDIPLEVIDRIKRAGEQAGADVVLTEIGGTVGEYQNILFLEAVRMMKVAEPDNVAVIMVSYLPVPGSVGEMKTKPTQTAVRALNSVGVFADMIIARSPEMIDKKRKEKIATFCNVRAEDVIAAPDVPSIYDIPVLFEKEGVSKRLCTLLQLPCKERANLTAWKRFLAAREGAKKSVKIAVVGKYFSSGDFVLSDVYISVLEAIKYSAYELGVKPEIEYVSSLWFEDGTMQLSELEQYDGVLVPGGFGKTGIAGKLKVIQYVREHKIPYFGICYGMQLMVLEYALNVLGLTAASTEEIDPKAEDLIIGVMEEQRAKLAGDDMGGTMRLGAYPTTLQKGSVAAAAYGVEHISERHRHRYEVNNVYVSALTEAGLLFSGTSPAGDLMEVAELSKKQHPFFLGVQYHPELKAQPLRPHPLFTAFVKASAKRR